MFELIAEILRSPAGSFASAFALVGVVVYLVHWVTKKITEIRISNEKTEASVEGTYNRINAAIEGTYNRINTTIESVSKRLDSRIDSVSKQLDSRIDSVSKRLDSRIDKVDEHIYGIHKELSVMNASLALKHESAHGRVRGQEVVQRRSPMSLTELGEKLYADFGAGEMIDKNWDKIAENIETNVHSQNAYDIQKYIFETALVSLETFIGKSNVEKMKLLAYTDGNPLAYYAPVFWIPIRDRYLKLKGINVAEAGSAGHSA
ncbi:MAG: apolipoprotein A1/A4/E family protein [Prevotellaceae bacterium]|nr:apolipoprotein A1/A4/E family protein [Prevotellaceae bacterium]